jgi:hypothetical protein
VLPALLGALGVSALLAFLKKLTGEGVRLHWKAYAVPALLLAGLGALEQLNAFPVWLASYDTSTPLDHHYVQLLTGAFTGVLVTGAGIFAALLAADVFLQMAYPQRRLPQPSVGRAIGVAVLVAAAASLLAWMRQHVPGPHRDALMWDLPGVDNWMPGLSAVTSDIVAALLAVAIGVIALCGAMALTDRSGRIRLVLAVTVGTAIGQALTPLQFPFVLAMALFAAGATGVVVMTCGLDLLAIGAGLFLAMAIPDAVAFAQQPENGFVWHSAVVIVAALGVPRYLYSRSGSGFSGHLWRG